MKKQLFYSAIAATSILVASCGGGTETATTDETTPASEAATVETKNWTIDTDQSNVRWEGGTSGVMVYSHFGSIKLKSGSLTTEGDNITGGNFVVDMTTIKPEDNGYNEENTPEKLVGHLSTGDFFLVEQFPTASFTVKSMNGSAITGDLTIRDKTNEETVNIENMEVAADGTMKATGTLVFDRQKYGVAWAHFMKDVLLKDDISLQITLVARAS
ncbi:MAG: YceI family protein [Flavobacteriales bacterium]|nr:YceI family protein [Flavobacteriales bacterium]